MPDETHQLGDEIDLDGALALLGPAMARGAAAMAAELTRGGHGGT